ncbi:hypothetical protein BC826DRAFT_1014827 [Russula brevipes]|nr:hypothetical protein BC826DRAFT_1014827 [Russula brevipes]
MPRPCGVSPCVWLLLLVTKNSQVRPVVQAPARSLKKPSRPLFPQARFPQKLHSTLPPTPRQRTHHTHNMNSYPFHTVTANDAAFWSRGETQGQEQTTIWSETARCVQPMLEFNSALGGPTTVSNVSSRV